MSAARGQSWIGIAVVAVLIALHLVRVPRPLEEVKLLASVMLIGGLWDSGLVSAGLLTYPHGTLLEGSAPGWIFALWMLFAAQFNTTYQWLKTRIVAAAILGAVAGPLSFRAGVALGALRFAKPWPAASALAIGWALLLPLVVILSRRWDGVRGLGIR